MYLHDLDNNGIEVYRERTPFEWRWLDQNKVFMVTEPLDVQCLINQDGNEKWTGLMLHTSMGHVLLHISNLVKEKNVIKNNLVYTILRPILALIFLLRMHTIIILLHILGLEQT